MKKISRNSQIRALAVIMTIIVMVPTLNGCFKALRGIFANESGLKFDHAKHAGFISQCGSCHIIEEGEISRAKHKDCIQCHSINESEKSAKCLICHTGDANILVPVKPVKRPGYGLAPPRHEAHANANVSCNQCHGRVDRDRRLSSIDFLRMEDCVSCHFPSRQVTDLRGECAYCHLSISRDEKPQTHISPLWYDVMHGKKSLQEPFFCMRCHQQYYCDQCHRVAPPKDHTSVFKQRGHGVIAVSRNTRCLVCHYQDFCIRCHTSTQPKYHTVTFKNQYPYLHCGMCHQPLSEGNRCRVCHFQLLHTEAKARAVPTPPFVDKSKSCFLNPSCHPVGRVPVRHLYNTIPPTQCTECHE